MSKRSLRVVLLAAVLLLGGAVAVFLGVVPRKVAVPRSDPPRATAGEDPCAEQLRIERVEEALIRAEIDPSVRACIETPPPKEEALRSSYARLLWFKAMGYRDLGDTERELAALQESLTYDRQVGTQVAIGSVLYREGRLEEARRQIAATALVAMDEGASAPVLEDLFFTQVLVDRDAYRKEQDPFGRERLCRSANRFLQLAAHHAFSEGNVAAVQEMVAEHCRGLEGR